MATAAVDGRAPLVIRGKIDQWPARSWQPRDQLKRFFGKSSLAARFGPLSRDATLRAENQCDTREMTFEEVLRWSDDDEASARSWCYVAYQHVANVASAAGEFTAVDWASIGLPTAAATDSALWYGTRGAHTNCHYDAYGFNVHAQLAGGKLWLLWPPHADMRPTRLPYEDTTVWSGINVPALPDRLLRCGGAMLKAVLQPGDVLYVPRHWWHFTLCLGESLSVNHWHRVHDDQAQTAHEAVTNALARTLPAGLVNSAGEQADSWLSPSECVQMADASCSQDGDCEASASCSKRAKRDGGGDTDLHRMLDACRPRASELEIVTDLAQLRQTFDDVFGPMPHAAGQQDEESSDDSPDFDKRFFHAVLHPRTVQCIVDLLNESRI